MPRYITTLQALGKSLSWTILQQAKGIPEAKAMDDFLAEKTFVVLFSSLDLAERLCCSAAIRQMSGHVVYMGPQEGWVDAVARSQKVLLGALSFYIDGCLTYGVPTSNWNPETDVVFPVLNCGNDEAHPAHALADIICMMNVAQSDLRNVRLAYLGCPCGTLYSLIAATEFFPFGLSIGVPANVDRRPLELAARKARTDITFHDSPDSCVRGCRFVMAGSVGSMTPMEVERWSVTTALMDRAGTDSMLMTGSAPRITLPMDQEIMVGHRSLLLLQGANRLRVYKRMLHWLYEF